MSIQTSVSSNPVIGYAGQLAEPGAPSYRVSYAVTGSASDDAVVFGNLLIRGALANTAAPIASGSVATSATSLGICMYESSREPGISAFEPVTVIRKGIVFVRAGEAVTAGAQATYGVGTAPTLNVWGVTEDANRVEVQGARWSEAVSSGSIGRLELDLMAVPTV